jgi:hypothetical protein
MAIWSKKATGNIAPSRFVKQSVTTDNQVTQAGAGEKVFGISQAGTRRTPYGALDDGYAAIANEDVQVFGVAENCLLEISATVAAGDRLKADADGKGTPTVTNLDEYGAIALVAGTTGQLIQVEVRPGLQISAA